MMESDDRLLENFLLNFYFSKKRNFLAVRSRAIREMDGDLNWTILKVSFRNSLEALKAATGIRRAQIETDELQRQSLKLPRHARLSRDVVTKCGPSVPHCFAVFHIVCEGRSHCRV